MAAESGDLDSMMKLSFLYLFGCGVPKDVTLSDKWLKRAADKGDSRAKTLYNMIDWYNIEASAEKGTVLMRALLEDGTMMHVAQHMRLTMKTEPAKTARLLELICQASLAYPDLWSSVSDRDRAEIYYMYGTLKIFPHQQGHGHLVCQFTPKAEKDKGMEYLTKAAELGSTDAATSLSQLYDEAGSRPEIEKYKHWRKKSMELGGADHAMIVARTLDWENLLPNTQKQWIKSAAKLGNEEARTILNKCHGPGCDKVDPTGTDFKSCKCKKAIYCSNECSKRHWKNGHKGECQQKEN